jgi:transmembrane sensor
LDELIIRFLRGEADAAATARLAVWREASSANERHFQDTAAIWRATTPGQHRPAPSASTIMGRAEARSRGIRPRSLAALAAMLLLGLAIGEFRPTETSRPALGFGEFVTGATEMATARLSDGTVVRLAPRSRLQVIEHADHREVWLEGKAYFAVEANDHDPFVVRTRAGQAHVLGTRFEVAVLGEEFRVIVLEGRVDVGAGDARVSLAAGQVAQSTGGAPPSVLDHGNVAGLVDWVGAFLAFESTPLHRVAAELEHRFDIEIVIQDRALRDRTITAWFGDEDIESVLAVICRIADVRCTLRDDTATMGP